MNLPIFRSSFWLRLEVWWFVLTIIYSTLVLMGLGFKIDCLDVCTHPPLPNGLWWVDVIGLFVPVGPNNGLLILFASAGIAGWIGMAIPGIGPLFGIVGSILPFVILFFIVHIGERYLARMGLTPAKKILANLLFLFLFSLALDFLIFQEWAGLDLVLRALSGK